MPSDKSPSGRPRGQIRPAMDQVQEWFKSRGWKVFPFQKEVWSAYLNGESGLVHATTGTGKTLAAWFGPVIEALAEAKKDPSAIGDVSASALDHSAESPRDRHAAFAAGAAGKAGCWVDYRKPNRRHVAVGAKSSTAAAAIGFGDDSGKPVTDADSRGCGVSVSQPALCDLRRMA